MRTRQKTRVATDTWRSLGCRTTPLEHWTKENQQLNPGQLGTTVNRDILFQSKYNISIEILHPNRNIDLNIDVPRSTSYGVYISQHIRFARVSSHVADFNARNKSLTSPTGLSVS